MRVPEDVEETWNPDFVIKVSYEGYRCEKEALRALSDKGFFNGTAFMGIYDQKGTLDERTLLDKTLYVVGMCRR